MQVCKYASIQVCKFACTQVGKFALCKYESTYAICYLYMFLIDVKHFVCSIQFISYFSYEIKHKMIQPVTKYCSYDGIMGA